MTSRSIFTSFGRRHCLINSSFNAKRYKSSSKAVNSSKVEDDTFSELGPDISKYTSFKQIKLATEKPDHFVKTEPSGRDMAGRSVSTVNKPKTKSGAIPGRVAASPNSCPKLGYVSSNSSASSYDSSKISGTESSPLISVQNVCATVGLYELVEAISIFGKVSGASFVNDSNGSRCCEIKFESVESSRRAILAGGIELGSQIYPVTPLDTLNVTTVRIKNISQKTSEHVIHLMCKSAGELVGLARTNKDYVDVLFNVRNETICIDILKRLNSMVIDKCSWSANIVESNSCGAGGDKLKSWINDEFSEMKRQILMQRTNLEDLETLVSSIIHIQEEHSI